MPCFKNLVFYNVLWQKPAGFMLIAAFYGASWFLSLAEPGEKVLQRELFFQDFRFKL